MKRILMLLLLVAASSSLVFAHHPEPAHKDNLLFMVRQKEHVNQVLKTIEYMYASKDTGLKPGNIVIIVCGEAVTLLTEKEAEGWVKKSSAHPNVSLTACGLSLEKFGKGKSDLVKGVDFVDNGFVHAFKLQKSGYLSVEL